MQTKEQKVFNEAVNKGSIEFLKKKTKFVFLRVIWIKPK